jgi:hypothetical protein
MEGFSGARTNSMFMFQIAVDCIFVIGLMVVGDWLDSIGEKTCWADRFLTPVPFGVVGVVNCVFMERVFG